MYKKILIILITWIALFSTAAALTKPGLDSDLSKFSYVFYLYYDNGQIFADRDYEVKFDILPEAFVAETPNPDIAYTAQIFNLKPQPEIVQTFKFDPKKGNSNFTKGKITVKGPYVSDALKVQFSDNKGNQLASIFINAGSVCNDDGICNSGAGESEKTCSNDCKKPRSTPIPVTTEQTSSFAGGLDVNMIIIYVSAGVAVIVLAWFGWRWWKKHKEGSFLPPTPPTPPSMPTLTPPPLQ